MEPVFVFCLWPDSKSVELYPNPKKKGFIRKKIKSKHSKICLSYFVSSCLILSCLSTIFLLCNLSNRNKSFTSIVFFLFNEMQRPSSRIGILLSYFISSLQGYIWLAVPWKKQWMVLASANISTLVDKKEGVSLKPNGWKKGIKGRYFTQSKTRHLRGI